MITTTYRITGMTCGHCVGSVREALGSLPGVTDVDADLATGEAVVTSDGALDDERARAAVEVAGYVLAP